MMLKQVRRNIKHIGVPVEFFFPPSLTLVVGAYLPILVKYLTLKVSFAMQPTKYRSEQLPLGILNTCFSNWDNFNLSDEVLMRVSSQLQL